MTPVRKYRKDYSPSAFQIPSTHLIFEIHDRYTLVKNRLHIERTDSTATTLTLDGVDLELISLEVAGTPITEYTLTSETLSIDWNYGESVTLDIVNKIYPEANTHLEGLYFASGLYCTQCEPEGFRRITYSIDRPDVMSRFHVRIEAENKYPVLLSNGNKISE